MGAKFKIREIYRKGDRFHSHGYVPPSVQTDVPSDNKRLRSSNVKKVLSGVLEYYSDLLSLQLQDFPMPDPAKVVDGSSEDVCE